MTAIAAEGATPLLDRIATPDDLRRLARKDLSSLAAELRADLIRSVAKTGGHLGSSLGVVELTIALHHVFDTPRDKLIWDVGHQCYPHKILTGRRDRMATLRKKDGLSGFTRRAESEHDPFGAAHSSTSLAAGLGFAAARDRGAADIGEVVCVIGDGALSAGMAFEGLNNAAASGSRVFLIVNDNAMSISPSTGALSAHLVSLSQRLQTNAGNLFETLGIPYHGPVDGHDMDALLDALDTLKRDARGPVLLHVRTRKGAGYRFAEASADKYHGVSRFDVASGKLAPAAPAPPSYTQVFAEALIAEAGSDERIIAITAAMAEGTGVDRFRARFPDRAVDVGIAEQHAVTFAAGLAAAGFKPFCAIYSTFLQRAYDQIVHDVALQGLPVRFAIDRAGLVGADGPTHAGAYDIAFLSNLPGFTVMAAADEAELCHMVATAAAHDAGPIALRYPRGSGTGIARPERGSPLAIGKGRVLLEGEDVALLSLGARLAECLAAAEDLAAHGIRATVADARFAKPLDTNLVETLATTHRALITIEGGASGGFGASVLQHLASRGALDGRCALRTMTLPDHPIGQGSPDEMYALAGLRRADIAALARAALATMPRPGRRRRAMPATSAPLR